MSKLTTGQRDAMPKSQFALPGGRFPVNDASHARAALSGASRAESVGNITPGQKATIDAKAKAKLGDHPRDHALAKASATHLHNAGYISGAKKAEIHAAAGKKLAQHKAKPAAPIGALGQSSHYMTTVNPQAAQDGDY
jgi:hypothetical protein